MNKKNTIIGVLTVVVGALLVVGIRSFAHVCTGMEDMTPMCHSTRTWVIVLGAAIAVVGLVTIFIKGKFGSRIMGILLLVLGVIGFLLPTVIAPVCEMATMHCRTHSLPFIMIMSVVTCILALVTIAIGGRKAA